MTDIESLSANFEQPASINIKTILLQYAKYWYLFLAGAVLSLGAAYAYLHYYAVPQYNVHSTLLIKDDKSGQGLSNADAFTDLETFKSTRNIDNEIQVLKSKSLMRRTVNELGLFNSYYIEGPVHLKEIYGRTSPIKVLISKLDTTASNTFFTINLKPGNTFEFDDYSGKITSHSFGQQISKPYGTFTIVSTPTRDPAITKIIVCFNDISQVADYYNQAIAIQPTSKTSSILYLSLTDPLPEKAKDIVNMFMKVYNKEAVEDKNSMATNTLAFLDERLRYVTNELSTVEKGVEQYKRANGLTDISTQAASFTEQASNYNKQLSEWAIQIDVLESIESYLRNTTNQYSMVPSTLSISDATLLGLIGKFNELQLERERMLRTTLPNNPLVQNLNEQLANLRVNILENLRNIKRGLQITSTNLKASSGQFQSQIKRVPVMEREMQNINRQQAIKQNIYTYLLQKREETALSLAATASAARVLDPAMGGDFPVSPNRQTTYLMALLLGLGLPFAGIYGRSLLNNKVQSQQDVVTVTAAPIIGEIAHNKLDTIVVTKGSRSPLSEMFRLIRANLNFVAIGKKSVTLLVTSSMSGEGKTFFCINLGASLALTGKRVVLLDLDLRNPKIAMELDLPTGPGLTDYLVGDGISITDILRFSEKASDLCVISAGTIPPNPSELLMRSKFADLMHELKESFDYILIDTPPVGQVADAFALSPFADFALYLVRYNYTDKAQLGIIKNIYNNKTLSNPMIVLNDAREANGSNYGFGYGYGYNQGATTKKAITY
jgi:tyrosine-protein kinase Etk/Wzc